MKLKDCYHKILRKLAFRYFKPQMVLGYYCKLANKTLANTRISNTTSITDEDKMLIGNNVFIGHFNNIDASGGLTIGCGCQISNYVSIVTHSSHTAIRLYGDEYIKYNGKHLAYHNEPTSIGCYTFIGPHVTIMPGAQIGDGSIIKSHSYVKRGFYPDGAILAGNPATIIGNTKDIDEEYLAKEPLLNKLYFTHHNCTIKG